MKKEIKTIKLVDKKEVLQITTVDERWYSKKTEQDIEYIPSVSWISQYTPKGVAYYKWLASKGWNEAEEIKNIAGDKGNKVHYAVADFFMGKTIKIDDCYINPTTNEEEELTVEEYGCILSICEWDKIVKPQILAVELTAFGDGYAGTIDYIMRFKNEVKINRQTFPPGIKIIDLKTSKNIWPNHKAQINGYNQLDVKYEDMGISEQEWAERQMIILQTGYRMNKMGYKTTPIENNFDLFLSAKTFWKEENEGKSPKQRDYPMSIKRGGE